MLLVALVLSAATAPLLSDPELPAPPIVDVPSFDPIAPAPAPRGPAPVGVPAATTLEPVRPLLLATVPLLERGSGGFGVQLTSLGGAAVLLTQASADATRGPWSVGIGLASGGDENLALSLASLRGAFAIPWQGAVDLGAAITIGGGLASRGPSTASERVGVVAMSPEVNARVRLLPWLRAHAALSYRFVNAGAWSGVPGDAMGGAGVGLGLDFGRFE